MKKISNKITVLIVLILFWAMGGAFLFVYGHLFLSVVCFLIVIYAGYKLYKLNIKTVNQFRVFTDSIKFSENSISFLNDTSDTIYLQYYESLERALDKINQQTQKREADIGFYNTLLNRVDFSLIVTDRTEKIVWINKAALDLLGRPRPSDMEAVKKISFDFRQVLESLQPKSPKTLRLEVNGKVRSLIINLSTISIRGDQFSIYSFKDVQSVVDETEDTAWQQLIRVLTHEIMNSLTPIISLSENLSANEDDPKLLSKAMETIYRRSKGLVSFVNNYKKLAQIPQPQRSSLVIKSLVDDVVHLMKGQGVEPHVLVTSADLSMYADRGQIEQVLINLITNAREACNEVANPSINITVTGNLYGQAIITVADNGVGMDSDVLEKIFTPFYTTKPTGSGIGLSVCRQIIVMHGGTLTASSVPGKGSVFTIRI